MYVYIYIYIYIYKIFQNIQNRQNTNYENLIYNESILFVLELFDVFEHFRTFLIFENTCSYFGCVLYYKVVFLMHLSDYVSFFYI